MCTVSVVPAKGAYIFTFSRDEAPDRYTPLFGEQQQLEHKKIFFAKDSRAGGSWFTADDHGNIAMLFNGAFCRHEHKDSYTKSRGVILMELFAAAGMKMHFEKTAFTGTAPFSVILFEQGILYRLTWDGVQKHVTALLTETGYIFSSATLYDESIQAARRQWLAHYLKAQQHIDGGVLLHFHTTYKDGDRENGLVIKRPGSCSTLSISQAVVKPGVTVLKHIDLIAGQIFEQQIFSN